MSIVSVQAVIDNLRKNIDELDELIDLLNQAGFTDQTVVIHQLTLQRTRLDRMLEWLFNNTEALYAPMPTDIDESIFFGRKK